MKTINIFSFFSGAGFLDLGFEIEPKTAKAMEKLSYLLKKLNPDKIKEEERKSK